MGFLKNNRGMGLIEVMIASSIMLIVIAAVSKLFISQMQAVTFVEDKLNAMTMKQMLMFHYMDQGNCEMSLRGLPIDQPQMIADIRDINNNIIVPTPTMPEKMSVRQIEVTNVNTPIVANGQGQVNLTVLMDRQRQGGGPDSLVAVVPLSVTLDGSSDVFTCNTVGMTPPLQQPLPAQNSPVVNNPNGSCRQGVMSINTSGSGVGLCFNGAWIGLGSLGTP